MITSVEKCLLCNNNSKIPERVLHDVIDVVEARLQDIIRKWHDFYGQIRYYC